MKAHLVGSGIASLAAATYLVKDGGFLANNITIYEAGSSLGGAMGMSGGPEAGYVLPTGRLFEKEFRCTLEFLSLVPSASDPHRSIKDEMVEFNERYGYDDRARIMDRDGNIVSSEHFGLSVRDRADLLKIAVTPEDLLDGKPISDFFSEEFFQTEFWFLWVTTMGSLRQHSAIEFRRFMYRFLHLVPEMSNMKQIWRTRYDQHEAISLPLTNWLKKQGVTFLENAIVTDIEFKSTPERITANSLEFHRGDETEVVEIAGTDLVLVTNGSQVADMAVGSMAEPPELTLGGTSWALWRRLARGRPEFGKPDVFFGEDRIPDTKWMTFTVTTRDPTFFELMTTLTGSEPGRGGLMTLKDSGWLTTVTLFHQPEFRDQPDDVMVWWGYAIRPDRAGDHVGKPMSACSGAEILRETLLQLGFADHLETIVASSICIPVVLPYANSVWMNRHRADRPKAVPAGSTNFGFMGQFVEIPDEAVFIMEYSIRSARMAVATLLDLDEKPPPIYRPHHDPAVLERVLKALA